MDPGSVARVGTLYVVATPLGHLEDLSARAKDILRAVPIVAAEDTRHTRKLLSHIGASPRLLSFHAHSPPSRRGQLLEALEAGSDVALVSDAGTPGISDPGAALVQAVRAAGFSVVPIPGASAVIAALSASGLPADQFVFMGFLPRKGAERRRLLLRAAGEEWTTVLYEAPPRLVALLRDLAAAAGPDRVAIVCREISKVHEDIRHGTLSELASHFDSAPPKGEVTLVLAGTGRQRHAPHDRDQLRSEARALLESGLTRRTVVDRLTRSTGLPRNEVYRLVMELP